MESGSAAAGSGRGTGLGAGLRPDGVQEPDGDTTGTPTTFHARRSSGLEGGEAGPISGGRPLTWRHCGRGEGGVGVEAVGV